MIYQFTKLIDWPANTKAGMFRIGVLGSPDVYIELSEVAMSRTVGSQNIEVMNVMSINQLQIAPFHILVVCESFCNSEKFKEINTQLQGKPTLVITYKPNYKNYYSSIGIESDGLKYRYNYNQSLIQSKGLKCSKDFLMMGKKRE